MIATLFWKEYREHRSVWLTLAVLATVTLVALTEVLGGEGPYALSPGSITLIVVVTIALVMMQGLVCGAMMIAGERESGSLPFLDALPSGRMHIWWSKALTGLLFTLLYSLLVTGIALVLGLTRLREFLPPVWVVVLPLVAVESFAWGLFASALCRNVLTAVALAALVPLVVIWLFCGLIPLASGLHGAVFSFVARGGLSVVALFVSANAFNSAQWERRFTPVAVKKRGSAAPARAPQRWQAMLWLLLRQGQVEVGLTCAAGFLLGLSLPQAGPALWAGATLFAGLLAGTAVFAGEQAEGSFRFLGDQRLPVGWIWARKTGFWLGTAAAASALMFLAGVLHLAIDGRHANVFRETPAAVWDAVLGGHEEWFNGLGRVTFAGLWLLTGFAVGQLCSLCWKKRAVAVVVSVLAGAGGVALWAPSLLAGGLHVWQVVGAPVLVLAACRAVTWAWVTDRLRTRKAVATLAGGVLLAVAWVAANLAYRVREVPGRDEPFDVAGFQKGLTSAEQARAARLLREAVQDMDEHERLLARQPGAGFQDREGMSAQARLERVARNGWAGENEDFGRWVEAMAAGPWVGKLHEAAGAPPGGFIDPRAGASVRSDVTRVEAAAHLLIALAARQHTRGEHEAALDQLRTALDLSRHLRQGAVGFCFVEGLVVEDAAVATLVRALPALVRKPESARRALDMLTQHEAVMPSVSDALKAEYVRMRDALRSNLSVVAGGPGSRPSGTWLGPNMATYVMQAPWEEGRTERLVNAVFAGRLRAAEEDYYPEEMSGSRARNPVETALADWRPAAPGSGGGDSRKPLEGMLRQSWLTAYLPPTAALQRVAVGNLCRLRAARTLLALAIYQRRHQEPAAALKDLVPELLSVVPTDPFSGRAFGYRLSAGERLFLAWPPTPEPLGVWLNLAPKQGVVWSVGPDGTDDGGVQRGADAVSARDLIFVVPP